ncbi:hypothetical protein J6590_028012 [Homalodisca vitripennis]|nr:hypothetical protein J6590_028012 [Homalodisca vitripennis]
MRRNRNTVLYGGDWACCQVRAHNTRTRELELCVAPCLVITLFTSRSCLSLGLDRSKACIYSGNNGDVKQQIHTTRPITEQTTTNTQNEPDTHDGVQSRNKSTYVTSDFGVYVLLKLSQIHTTASNHGTNLLMLQVTLVCTYS